MRFGGNSRACGARRARGFGRFRRRKARDFGGLRGKARDARGGARGRGIGRTRGEPNKGNEQGKEPEARRAENYDVQNERSQCG